MGMSKSMKIGCALAGLAGVALVAGVIAIVYFAVQFAAGAKLARQGFDEVALQKYDEAITSLTGALAKPLSAEQRAYIYLNRGAAYNTKRRFDDAIGDFNNAARLKPDLAYAYAGRGWAYEEKHEIEKAVVDLSEASRRDPNSYWAHYNLGTIYLREKKEPEHALAEFNEAVRCAPDTSDALVMRASCYEALHDYDRALASLDGAIMLNPNNGYAFRQRSIIYGHRGETDKLLRDADTARRLMPPPSRLTTDDHRSPSSLERAAQLNLKPLPNTDIRQQFGRDESFDGLMRAGDTAFDARDFDKAIQAYDRAIALDVAPPQASLAVLRRGNSHSAKEENDLALADYEEAIRLDPRNAAAYDNRAMMLQNKGDRSEAMKDFNEAIRLNPRHALAYCNRGFLFYAEGEIDPAASDYSKAIELEPNEKCGHVGMAGVYLARNQNEQAVAECNRVLELDAHALVAYLNRARAHAHFKQQAAALADLEAALKSTPNDPAPALNSVAWIRATAPDDESELRDGKRAVQEASKACDLTRWHDWRCLDTLAAAYAEAGEFPKAIETQTDALAKAKGEPMLIEAAQQRLSLYRQHKPFRDDPYHQRAQDRQ
jgi:tetratricopeptide (TPR) repeat protein